jgi:tetratricopeptide (TPR) repeat protein
VNRPTFLRLEIVRRPVVLLAAAGALAVLSVLLSGCGNVTASARNAEGVRLFQQARYHEAIRHFQEATYTDPGNPDGYYNLAATHHRLGILENRPSDLEQAERYYNMCLDECERRGRSPRDGYRGLATLLVEQGRTDDAMRLLQGWVDREPSSADARIELARLSEEFGDRHAAKERLLEALAIEPDSPRALAALGRIREESGEQAEALTAYQRSLAKNPFQADVAARVAALQSRSAVGGWGAPPALTPGARLVDRTSGSLR